VDLDRKGNGENYVGLQLCPSLVESRVVLIIQTASVILDLRQRTSKKDLHLSEIMAEAKGDSTLWSRTRQ
jgi:hypothetical protein